MLTLWCPQFILEVYECGAVRKTPGKLGKTKRSKVQNASQIADALVAIAMSGSDLITAEDPSTRVEYAKEEASRFHWEDDACE